MSTSLIQTFKKLALFVESQFSNCD